MTFEEKITDPFLKAAIEMGKREIPGFTIKFKDESRLMKATNQYARLFNPTFMTGFHTTLGSTMYLISEERALMNQRNLVSTVFHEITHMHDRNKSGFLPYTIGYIMPQLLAALAAPMLILSALLVLIVPNRIAAWISLSVGIIVSAILWSVFVSPWMLLFFLPIIALAPIPSPWRTKWERRGYAMSAAVEHWMNKVILSRTPERMQEHFTGWNYYRMCPNEDKVLGFLRDDVSAIESGMIKQDDWYRKVHAVIVKTQQTP